VPYIHGKNAALVHGSIDLSPWLTDVKATAMMTTGETSHLGSSPKTYIAGLLDGTITASGLYDSLVIGGAKNYMVAVVNTEVTTVGVEIPITFLPEGYAIGGMAFLMLAKQTQYDINAVISSVETVSLNMQGTGGPSFGVNLGDTVPVSVTTASASVDNLAPTSAGARFFGHILSNANTGNVTVTLQHSTNNSTWVDLIALPVVTTGTLTAFRTGTIAGTVNRYLRLNLTLAGTGAVSVAASASRN
jgi:hypothetical protein